MTIGKPKFIKLLMGWFFIFFIKSNYLLEIGHASIAIPLFFAIFINTGKLIILNPCPILLVFNKIASYKFSLYASIDSPAWNI